MDTLATYPHKLAAPRGGGGGAEQKANEGEANNTRGGVQNISWGGGGKQTGGRYRVVELIGVQNYKGKMRDAKVTKKMGHGSAKVNETVGRNF